MILTPLCGFRLNRTRPPDEDLREIWLLGQNVVFVLLDCLKEGIACVHSDVLLTHPLPNSILHESPL